MSSTGQWDLIAAFPLIAATAGMCAIATSALVGAVLRVRRRRAQVAQRQRAHAAPWHEWLRRINEQKEKTVDRAR